jgi:hypothetical protein
MNIMKLIISGNEVAIEFFKNVSRGYSVNEIKIERQCIYHGVCADGGDRDEGYKSQFPVAHIEEFKNFLMAEGISFRVDEVLKPDDNISWNHKVLKMYVSDEINKKEQGIEAELRG